MNGLATLIDPSAALAAHERQHPGTERKLLGPWPAASPAYAEPVPPDRAARRQRLSDAMRRSWDARRAKAAAVEQAAPYAPRRGSQAARLIGLIAASRFGMSSAALAAATGLQQRRVRDYLALAVERGALRLRDGTYRTPSHG